MTLGDFSQQAAAYKDARPTYPAEMIDLLLRDAGLQPGDRVAEFGAGTGIFTRLLCERALAVTAIEPNQAMRDASEVPAARWLNGTFEQSGLESSAYCWAVAAQAFHWANPSVALPEVRRVLQPGRLLTIVWNNRANDKSDVLAWTEEAIRRHVPGFDEAYRNRDWAAILESTGDFVFTKYRVVTHPIVMSKERYLALWRSHNRLNTIAGPERFANLLDELSQYLTQRSLNEITVPYRCEAWSARRKD